MAICFIEVGKKPVPNTYSYKSSFLRSTCLHDMFWAFFELSKIVFQCIFLVVCSSAVLCQVLVSLCTVLISSAILALLYSFLAHFIFSSIALISELPFVAHLSKSFCFVLLVVASVVLGSFKVINTFFCMAVCAIIPCGFFCTSSWLFLKTFDCLYFNKFLISTIIKGRQVSVFIFHFRLSSRGITSLIKKNCLFPERCSDIERGIIQAFAASNIRTGHMKLQTIRFSNLLVACHTILQSNHAQLPTLET